MNESSPRPRHVVLHCVFGGGGGGGGGELWAESDSQTIVKELVLRTSYYVCFLLSPQLAHIIDTKPRSLHHGQQQRSQF
jgi:hypothetical protein